MDHRNLIAGPPPTYLPDDPSAADLGSGADPAAVAAANPASLAAWAALAEQALDRGESVTAYAYARTGYHRGLDRLRRAGPPGPSARRRKKRAARSSWPTRAPQRWPPSTFPDLGT